MTTEDKLTPWFDQGQAPAREGSYEMEHGGYAYFDGEHWGFTDKTPEDAEMTYSMFGPQLDKQPCWRGLAECPQPDLFASL